MKVKFLKLEKAAEVPKKAHKTDAGFDLKATSRVYQAGCWVYGTGLAMEIPAGYVGLIFPRSSVSKTNMILSNCVGVIDSGYRGEIKAKFKPTVLHPTPYKVGEHIAQIIILPYPNIEFIEANTLTNSDRGTGGFGSSGK